MIKFGKLIQYIERDVFIHKLYRQRKEGDSIKSYFLKKKKSFISSKSKMSAPQFQYISTALNLAYNEDKLYKTLHY